MFLSRMMMAQPQTGAAWTHALTLETGATDIVGMGSGFGSISPTTFEGLTFEFFRTAGDFATTENAIVMRFGGSTVSPNHIQVEMEGVAGVYEFVDGITDFRHAAKNTTPANETLHAAMIAASGTTVNFRITLIAG